MMDHPNIAQIFDAGRPQRGALFRNGVHRGRTALFLSTLRCSGIQFMLLLFAGSVGKSSWIITRLGLNYSALPRRVHFPAVGCRCLAASGTPPSARDLRPCASKARYSLFSLRVTNASGRLNSPSKESERVTRLFSPLGSTQCFAMTRRAGAEFTQVKLRSESSSSVTRHSAGGSLGCRMRAQHPTASGPGVRSRTLLTVGVHSGHRSTSRIVAQTSSGEALISVSI
jgi:hypothetical protein